MADMVGARNIWDCIGRLQAGGDSSKSSESRPRFGKNEVSDQISETVATTSSQPLHLDGNNSSSCNSLSQKSKKRESISLLANMQKKLKISHFSLQPKAAESVDAKRSTGHECPLDLSTKPDDVTDVTSTAVESPLDLSLKKELESPLSCSSLDTNIRAGLNSERNIFTANSTMESGSLTSISKQFASSPFSPKKVSPVRPHIGGKPVVVDSNGNIPLRSFAGGDSKSVGIFSKSAEKCVVKTLSADSNENISIIQSSEFTQPKMKKSCYEFSATDGDCKNDAIIKPVQDLGQQLSRCSIPLLPVIDFRGNELLCSDYTAVMPSSNSLGNTTPVPDLVRSALGLDQCSDNGSFSKYTSRNCLSVPVYKCQRKSKLSVKKTLKSTLSIGDIQKRKSVPLAKVRPNRIEMPAPTAEDVGISDDVESIKFVPNLVSSLKDEAMSCSVSEVGSKGEETPISEAEQLTDSSGSPPVLALFSPLNKTVVTPSDSVLLSPLMPTLSPRFQSCIVSPSVACSTVAQRDVSSCIQPFDKAGTGTKTTHSRLDFKSLSRSEVRDEKFGVDTQNSENAASFLPSCNFFSASVGNQFRHRIVNCADFPSSSPMQIPKQDLFGETVNQNELQSSRFSDRNSRRVNAFLINSEFGKEVFTKSKLLFYASVAFDHEANASESNRPYKNFISGTKYFKLIAAKCGFSLTLNKAVNESDTQQRTPSKIHKGVKSCKLKMPENYFVSTKDEPIAIGRNLRSSGNKPVGRRSKTGELTMKQTPLSHDNYGVTSLPQISAGVHKIAQTTERKSLREESRNEQDSSATQICTNFSNSIEIRKAGVSKDSLAANHSSFVHTGDRKERYGSVSFLRCVDIDDQNLKDKRTASKKSVVLPSTKSNSNDLVDNSLNDSRKLAQPAVEVKTSDLKQSSPSEFDLQSKGKEKRKSNRHRNSDSISPKFSPISDGNQMKADGKNLRMASKTVKDAKSKNVKVNIGEKVSLSPKKSAALLSIKVKKDNVQRQNCEVDKTSSPMQKAKKTEVAESGKKDTKLASGRQSSSLLRELANSDGYVAEKSTPKRNDNLFIDSRFLSREERSLQMALMRMTKMEVKEEWSKCNPLQKKQKTEEQKKTGKWSAQESEEEYSRPKSKIVQKKAKKEAAQRLIHQNKKKITKVMSKGRKTELYKAVGSCKPVGINKPTKQNSGLSWMSDAVRSHTKKSGRFRYRWKSGIWKKPKHSPSPPKSKYSTSVRNVYSSLMVDIGTFVSPMVSLSPCSFVSSKLSPYFERTSTKDDDVISLSSSVADTGINRRTLPAEVKKLITCHATGETVLHRAARLGYTDVALWCCQANYVDVNTKDFAGYTPLHETFLHSNLSVARYLIHYGADLNNAAERRGGSRPLHEAVESDSVEMVRLMLSAGADINLTNYSGKTIEEVACSPDMKKFLKAYLNDLNGGTEVEWNFQPSWAASGNDDLSELGMDLLADVPCDEDVNCHSISFESSETLFLPTYNLKIHKEDMPRSYVLLCDILDRLQMTKDQFLHDYEDVNLEKLPWEYLCAQLLLIQSVNGQLLDEIRGKCHEPYVDVFCLTLRLKELLNIVVSDITV